MKRGAVLIGMLEPYRNRDQVEAYAEQGLTAFAMELMPRITRAQTHGRAVLAGQPRRLQGGARRRRRVRPRLPDDDDRGRHDRAGARSS